ncbi:TonB-dependent receptor plug domain-containing protein [Aromatoleum anaerobium]|uniref:TonB-dependent receptor n=1 Tax=Aromatoleum anaerobium TaxID=182180 RepID=A0ABX1PJ78_9RHOO|nr:TonB-dependent receptor [Aromatoleum anaerobium]MCK0506630.1 TonB-dependent receptor [Aromatoleum anaerobium]
MKKAVLRHCLLGLLSFTACAQAAPDQDAPAGGEESAELRDLLAVLDQQTEIATRTKMNADYVPGLVTVLLGDELEALGARTVWEALRLVPGIEPSTDQIGGRQTLVRGVGGTFASGNMKILLNSQSMNSALSANANPVLNMPIEQVGQIEVIRGPGSAIHGEFAYAGVINVITRKDADGVFARAGRFDTYGAGGFRHWRSEDGRSGGSMSFGGWHSRGARVGSGQDALSGIPVDPAGIPVNPLLNGTLSNAPGPVNDEMEQRSLLVDLYRDEYSLSASYVEDGNGDHFGTVNVLSQPDDGIAYRNRYFMVNGKGGWRPSETLATELRLGWQYYENRFDFRLLPAGLTWFTPLPAVLPEGWWAKGYYDEQRLSAEYDMHWSGWRDHNWLLSLGATHIAAGDAWVESNLDPLTRTPLPAPRRSTADEGAQWADDGSTRRILSLTLQDEYRLSDDVTVTAGLRYDDYDDVGDKLSPRLAAVWRLDRRHILKAQYAEAFRPPTFYEMAMAEAGTELSPETIKTTEFAYIYKGPATGGRATLFHSRLKDLIVGSRILQYRNAPGVEVDGVELELDQRLTSRLRLKANITLSDAEHSDTGDAVAGAADRLANLALVFQPTATQTYSLWLRHVGERAREAGDPRHRLSGYETVDATTSFGNVGVRGLTLRLGVSNLLDERVRYPAFLTRDVADQPIPSYAGDYPQPGRAGWVQLSYRM